MGNAASCRDTDRGDDGSPSNEEQQQQPPLPIPLPLDPLPGGFRDPLSIPPVRLVPPSDAVCNSPPESPARSPSPVLSAPQVPVAPLQCGDGPPFVNKKTWQSEYGGAVNHPHEKGIPIMITWNYGGTNVSVEGSWDNWTSRRILQRSGEDHSILLVLPSGVYHCKFLVDGEWRHIPDLPFIANERDHVCNVLDVHDYVPEILERVAEFEAPQSPDSSYTQAFPPESDFAKDPAAVPSQLHLTVLGMQNPDTASSSPSLYPQHVVLNHLFIERGSASQSVVAMGLTHRFQSKYVTVVLYKPLKRFGTRSGGHPS